MSGPIRLLIVDDHEVVRAGLRALFETVDRVEVVGEAEDLEGATAAVERTEPDVVLVDLRLRDSSGIDVCRRIRALRPRARLIVLTAYDDEEAASAALCAGADGFILKRSTGRDVIRAVKGVGSPAALIDAGIARRLLAPERVDPAAVHLAPVERDLAFLVASGLTNREISTRLGAPDATVKAQVSRLLARLGVSHRSEVHARLARLGIACRTGDDAAV